MFDRFRRSDRTPAGEVAALHRSFGTWDAVDKRSRRVVQVCHPDWMGVRAAAYAFRTPIVESTDFTGHAGSLVDEFVEHGVEVVVVHAWPPGADRLLIAASLRGLATRVIFHSSMAQHGTDAGEGEAVSEVLALADTGVVGRIGFVKDGLAGVFRSLGYDAAYVPNRVPDVPSRENTVAAGAPDVGIFLDPYWRKNVTTQLGAVALLGGRAHVARRPDVAYLDGVDVVEHGVLDRDAYLDLQAGMTINFNVTLSECHPMAPMESFLSGVPCLVSATSALFREDPVLYALATVAEADNPRAIADAANRLLENRSDAVDRARTWMADHDVRAAGRFSRFVSGDVSDHP